MLVRSNSWHYKLVSHKDFVSKSKDDNHDASNYIFEVWIALFVRYLVIPLVLTVALVVLTNLPNADSTVSGRSIVDEYGIHAYIFMLITSSPLWFALLLMVFELFTKKEWRKLKIV